MKRQPRWLRPALCLSAAAAPLALIPILSTGHTTAAATPAAVGYRLPACVSEDGSGGPLPCFWDASSRGNLTGADVINLTATSWLVRSHGRWIEHRSDQLPLSAWRANLRSEGFSKLSPETITGHGECWATIPDGDTAVAVCRDGYAATS